MADFDGAGIGIDSQVTGNPRRFAGGFVDDAEKHRVVSEAGRGEPLPVFRHGVERAVGQINPQAVFAVEAVGLEQVGAVFFEAQRFDDAVSTVHRPSPRRWRRRPVFDDFAEGCGAVVRVVGVVGVFGVIAIWHDCQYFMRVGIQWVVRLPTRPACRASAPDLCARFGK